MLLMLPVEAATGIVVPGALLRSWSLSRNRSLELMYIKFLWLRPVFLPQESCERRGLSSALGAEPRSMERLPMLPASSLREPMEPGDEGRDVLALRLRDLLMPRALSRLGLRGLRGLAGWAAPDDRVE